MVYVLANEAGSLYLYDRDGVFHNSSLLPGPAAQRRPGELVVVFDGAADAERYCGRHALFGDEFGARPARPGDDLGDTVCRVVWMDDGAISFDVIPTPADSFAETGR
jgi:hypothetical protein